VDSFFLPLYLLPRKGRVSSTESTTISSNSHQYILGLLCLLFSLGCPPDRFLEESSRKGHLGDGVSLTPVSALGRDTCTDKKKGFYINIPIGAVAAVIVVFTKWPADQPKGGKLPIWKTIKRLDPIGFVTFAPFCIMLLLALQWGGTDHPWNSSVIIGLFCGSFATLCIFIGWEYHIGDGAMMQLSLLRQRIVYSTLIVAILQFGGIQVFAYYLPVWFQVIKAASPAMSGVYFMGTVGPQMILAIISGVLSTYFSPLPQV
jgi:hypothetical protein